MEERVEGGFASGVTTGSGHEQAQGEDENRICATCRGKGGFFYRPLKKTVVCPTCCGRGHVSGPFPVIVDGRRGS